MTEKKSKKLRDIFLEEEDDEKNIGEDNVDNFPQENVPQENVPQENEQEHHHHHNVDPPPDPIKYRPEEIFSNATKHILETFLQQHSSAFHVLAMNFMLNTRLQQIIALHGHLETMVEWEREECDIKRADVPSALPEIQKTEDKIKHKYRLTVSDVGIEHGQATPEDCHTFELHYTCDIVGTLCLKGFDIGCGGDTTYTILGRLPLMTGCDDDAFYDIDGCFIIRGKVRTCPSVKTELMDFPIIMRKKDATYLQLRSSHHDKPFRSTSTLDLFIRHAVKKSELLGFIACKLPFAKKAIHVGVLVRGLGFDIAEFICWIKMMADSLYDEALFHIYETSLLSLDLPHQGRCARQNLKFIRFAQKP